MSEERICSYGWWTDGATDDPNSTLGLPGHRLRPQRETVHTGRGASRPVHYSRHLRRGPRGRVDCPPPVLCVGLGALVTIDGWVTRDLAEEGHPPGDTRGVRTGGHPWTQEWYRGVERGVGTV